MCGREAPVAASTSCSVAWQRGLSHDKHCEKRACEKTTFFYPPACSCWSRHGFLSGLTGMSAITKWALRGCPFSSQCPQRKSSSRTQRNMVWIANLSIHWPVIAGSNLWSIAAYATAPELLRTVRFRWRGDELTKKVPRATAGQKRHRRRDTRKGPCSVAGAVSPQLGQSIAPKVIAAGVHLASGRGLLDFIFSRTSAQHRVQPSP